MSFFRKVKAFRKDVAAETSRKLQKETPREPTKSRPVKESIATAGKIERVPYAVKTESVYAYTEANVVKKPYTPKKDRIQYPSKGALTPEEAIAQVEPGSEPCCPFCDRAASITTADDFYKSTKKYNSCVWYCAHCERVYVTTYEGTSTPKGTLADDDTRRLRRICHLVTEYKKKEEKLSHEQYYEWIATIIHVPTHEAYIGYLSLDKCRELVKSVNRHIYEERYAYIFNTIPSKEKMPAKYRLKKKAS